MAKEDLKKFQELLASDADFQEKFRKAAEAYTGEQDEKSVFDNLLLPLAKEHGLSATYDEFKEYMSNFAVSAGNELSEDELAQVAGGKDSGVALCAAVGIGDIFGVTMGKENTAIQDGMVCAVVGLVPICLGIGGR